MDNRVMMETEEDAAYVIEREEGETMESQEEEEGDIMESQEEEEGYIMESQEEEGDIMESESEGEEEEEEEVEQLEEMRPLLFTSWMDSDGITVDGIVSIDDGVLRFKNRCQFDDCAICYKPPSTTHGKHQICCLPCGHLYGFSCIKKWLLQSNSSGRCPQCNALCTIQDAILVYPPPLCVTAHQKASLTAFFPLTREGFSEFKEYETSRASDALQLQAHDLRHANILVRKHNNLTLRALELTRQSDNLLTQAEELEELGGESFELADALRRQASPLKPRIDALGRRTDALKRLVSAWRRRGDAFGQRRDAYEPRLRFFVRMYKEHGKTKKNNIEPCTSCMEKKDKKTMQAFGTVEVPKEEPVEDVEEEHEEEKVEEKAKPTTKTTRSGSNKGKGPGSISKVILKRK